MWIEWIVLVTAILARLLTMILGFCAIFINNTDTKEAIMPLENSIVLIAVIGLWYASNQALISICESAPLPYLSGIRTNDLCSCSA